MAKPMLDDDEDDALSMVMGDPAADGETAETSLEDPTEKPAKADSGRILDEVMAKLEELRGLVASV
jgi:hypothetical protein